ncbi:MAG: hypothetical protein SO454_05655 [Candidatus Choladocola sp.]|nr:hypothetical protein [Candidatus Choladocola sp.]
MKLLDIASKIKLPGRKKKKWILAGGDHTGDQTGSGGFHQCDGNHCQCGFQRCVGHCIQCGGTDG